MRQRGGGQHGVDGGRLGDKIGDEQQAADDSVSGPEDPPGYEARTVMLVT